MPMQAEIYATFNRLVAAAIAGERCPVNDTFDTDGIDAVCLMALCYAGRVRTKISGRNYRTVEILSGPHKGKTTAPDPHGHRVKMIVDEQGSRKIATGAAPKKRQLPSAPRLLPYVGKDA